MLVEASTTFIEDREVALIGCEAAGRGWIRWRRHTVNTGVAGYFSRHEILLLPGWL